MAQRSKDLICGLSLGSVLSLFTISIAVLTSGCVAFSLKHEVSNATVCYVVF